MGRTGCPPLQHAAASITNAISCPAVGYLAQPGPGIMQQLHVAANSALLHMLDSATRRCCKYLVNKQNDMLFLYRQSSTL
jgi:hypothetical protein